jgi:hypothetical protein
MNYQTLACALWAYEGDEPHPENEEKPLYLDITWAELEAFIKEEHRGNCIGLPATCVRCVAEGVVRKAKWLIEYCGGEKN